MQLFGLKSVFACASVVASVLSMKRAASFDEPPQKIRKEVSEAFFPNFLPSNLKDKVFNFLSQQEPQIVTFGRFKVPVTSRPQRFWSVPQENGNLPIYVYGQSPASFKLVEPMPDILKEAADYTEQYFGKPAGYLNSAFATFYQNGKDHHIVPHQDKSVAKESTGKVESTSDIFNLSLGATRAFSILTLDALTAKPADLDRHMIQSFDMTDNSMIRITADMNMTTCHMVARDAAAVGQRISLAFRHCTKKYLTADKAHYYTMVYNKKSDTWATSPKRPIK